MMTASARQRVPAAQARGGWAVVTALAAVAIGVPSLEARADVITLRGGGQVQGKVVPDPNDKDRVQVWMMTGRKPLALKRVQIIEVIPRSSPLDDYVVKLRKGRQHGPGPV